VNPFGQTPIWPGAQTDLRQAFEVHLEQYQDRSDRTLPYVEFGWLDAIRARSLKPNEGTLCSLTDEMMKLLSNPPGAGDAFRTKFEGIYDSARQMAYPLAAAIIQAHQAIARESRDYTLQCFDLGMLRQLEDQAATDATLRRYIDDLLVQPKPHAPHPDFSALPQAFETYCKALVFYYLLKQHKALTIARIEDPTRSNPDFECELRCSAPATSAKPLHFFIEVKTLNIVVDPGARLPEMRADALETAFLRVIVRTDAKCAFAS
jgi:hypothetical protein